MFDFAHVCAVESDRLVAVVLVAIHVHMIFVASLRFNVLYQVESNTFTTVRPRFVVVNGL